MTPEAKAYLQTFCYGAMAMTFFHNAWVSYFLFKARNSNVSNLLKIIINLAGLTRTLGIISALLVDPAMPLLNCQVLGYTTTMANVVFRVSLGGFMFYRVKQIEQKKYDTYIGCTLLFCSCILQIVHVFLREQVLIYEPQLNKSFCNSFQHPETINIQWTFLALDFAIDFYVTGRLIEILTKANQNAKHVTSNMRRPNKRTLFTSVMYWNFLRLVFTLLYHVWTGINAQYINQLDKLANSLTFVAIYIVLSYVVTADAEIVRVIEGRKPTQQKTLAVSAGSEKSSYKKFFRRGPTSTTTSDLAVSSISYEKPTSKHPEKYEEEAVFVSSMRRISFFEWAKVVVGKKDKNTEETSKQDEDSIEEIQQDATEHKDLELGLVDASNIPDDRRGSNFSATTIATELPGGEHISEKTGEAL